MRKLMIAASVLLLSAAMCAQEVPVEMKWLDDVPQSVMDSRLYGKRMVIMGDSYVKNHVRPVSETWHYKLAAKYHMEYHNYGWNGNCIAFDRTAQGFGPALCERYVTMTDRRITS